jgi:Protein of unknown function (DUF2934)
MQDLEQTIRERAYHLWMAEGCPDGNAEGHWIAAQREVLAASLENIGTVSTATKPKRATRKSTGKKAKAA